MRSCEVIVVGAGISGSAAAINLQRLGRDVILLEKRITSRVPLGETLSPACNRALAALGLSSSFPFQMCLQSSHVRMAWKSETLAEEDYSFHRDGPWRHVDHEAFRAWLVQEARLAGSYVVQYVGEVEIRLESRSGWIVRFFSSDGSEFTIQASILIDATGRPATVARRCGFRRLAYDKLLSISQVLNPQEDIPPGEWSALVEASRDGWWYSSAISTRAVVGTFMTDGPMGTLTMEQYWRNQLLSSRHTNLRLRAFQPGSGFFCLSAATIKTNPIATSNLFTVGDAAFTQDPLSSQGIQKALSSGHDVGFTINEVLDGRRAASEAYTNEMTKSFNRHLHLRREHYRRVTRFMDAPFWTARTSMSDQQQATSEH
jgi:flavin-dependent dehydrogenase